MKKGKDKEMTERNEISASWRAYPFLSHKTHRITFLVCMKRTASLTWFSSRCRLPAVRIIIPESNAIVPMTMPPPVISLNCMKVCALDVVGVIPDELWNLTFLTILYLAQNYLTGPLSASIGNLRMMQNISFGTTNFSGSLPSELGNLVNLEYLWASDNELTGNIPDFIGKWSKLTELRLQGNSFEGPIYSSFSSLTSLTNLVLRNNNISDSIPSNIGEYGSLTQLDLSFNNLSGQLPESLFNLSQLTYLFLGNNQLTGSLPLQKSTSLLNINLVTNSFTLDSSNRSVLPSGLNCLQQNFPCNRGSGIYYYFAIKCGGPQITSSDKIVFERDDGTLGPATYHVTETNRRVSFRAVKKEFKAQVSKNYIEIHLFWAGKGTCCVPAQGTYGPSISAISATPDFEPTLPNTAPNGKKNRTGLMVGLAVGVGLVCILSVFTVYYFVLRRKKLYESQDEVLLGMDARPYTFSYAELRNATEDFSPNKLGEADLDLSIRGHFDGGFVAVKQLSVSSHQGKNQFVTEIATISAVQHRNLVKLYGCCIEGVNRSLVYEYLKNKSLDKALFGNGSLDLDWPTRYDICLDFGLAKLYDDTMTHISTRVAGTIGYLASEYAMRGHLTEKADVFSFGVVALEIVSGRPNSDTSLEEEKAYLLEWASPTLQPPMSRVVAMLSGDIAVSRVPTKPVYLTDWKFNDVSSFMSENIHFNSLASISMAADADPSPVTAMKTELNEIVGEAGEE
ncbi:putative LRR receptor-like serine/threonine-protein kinase [Vitis vinifera]|uniref:non-specific serine/threonine protein kinase n=1 Tax=Vitis vinifera TaxID=29760 RepID=A0A438G2E3_VITVI|nr:putative LRR receptor-like serine/threonine-protein kinase [Vitis vinifera]